MNCENARLYYYEYLEQNDTIPSDVRSHLEQCLVCQEQLEHLRKVLGQPGPVEKPWRPKYLQLHYRLLDQWISCDIVRPFLPSLLVPQLGMKQQTPVTAHVENCPECQKALKEIASLRLSPSSLIKAARYLADEKEQEVEFDKTTCAVLNKVKYRNISDVLTRMRLEQTVDAECQWLSDSTIVDVERRDAKTVSQRQVLPIRTASVWVAGGIAAAILFAVLLVLPMRDVKALDVEQLYMTLATVRNVHIQKFDGSQEQKELENIWISEGLGAYLFQRGENTVFVNSESGKVYQQHQGTVQLVSQGGKMELERPWGLLPFKHISELPADYDWDYISDTVLEGGLNVQVYEWRWKETLSNQAEIQRIWRGYLDIHSHLPYRIESLDKIGDSPAQLIMEMKVTYPSDAECREVFENYHF
ncbi:MAG: hypothetical protein ISS71_04495 [Phycisphaerae bacterium]|nr:hypothetical protein [Phycisphaerae bacterium]